MQTRCAGSGTRSQVASPTGSALATPARLSWLVTARQDMPPLFSSRRSVRRHSALPAQILVPQFCAGSGTRRQLTKLTLRALHSCSLSGSCPGSAFPLAKASGSLRLRLSSPASASTLITKGHAFGSRVLVPGAGLEPARQYNSTRDFKSLASTIPPSRHSDYYKLKTLNYETFLRPGRELNPRMAVLQTAVLTTSPPGPVEYITRCPAWRKITAMQTVAKP